MSSIVKFDLPKRLVELAEDMETQPEEFLDKGKSDGTLRKMQVIFEQLE
jgi:hypothetical protein